jgi:DNA-binding transcriptional ArsR family regulator
MTEGKKAAADRKPPDDQLADRTALTELTDPVAIRALAHPTRQVLLELLLAEGSLTATECGNRLGESAAGCSFHLRQLAKYGFVEEAPGGTGRQRPWRLARIGYRMRAANLPAESHVAALRLSRMAVDRDLARLSAYLASPQAADPDEPGHVSNTFFYVTDDELAELEEELTKIFTRYRDRLADPAARPADAKMIYGMAYLFPTEPLAGTSYDDRAGGNDA